MIAKKNRHLLQKSPQVLPFGLLGDTTQKWRQQALTQELVPKPELGQGIPRPGSYQGADLLETKMGPRWAISMAISMLFPSIPKESQGENPLPNQVCGCHIIFTSVTCQKATRIRVVFV